MNHPFNYLTLMQFCWSCCSIIGFSIRMNLRGIKVLFIALGAGLNWGTYLVILHYSKSLLLSVFLSTLLVCIYCEIVARMVHTPVSVFVTCVIIPLVPGSSLFYAMRSFLEGDRVQASHHIAYVFLIGVTIAMAIAVVSSFTLLGKRIARSAAAAGDQFDVADLMDKDNEK